MGGLVQKKIQNEFTPVNTIATKAHLYLILLTIGDKNSWVSLRCTTLIKRTSNAHRPNRVRASNGNETRAGSKNDFITELSTRVRCCLSFDTISFGLIGWGSPVSRKHPPGCWDKVCRCERNNNVEDYFSFGLYFPNCDLLNGKPNRIYPHTLTRNPLTLQNTQLILTLLETTVLALWKRTNIWSSFQ